MVKIIHEETCPEKTPPCTCANRIMQDQENEILLLQEANRKLAVDLNQALIDKAKRKKGGGNVQTEI